MAIRVRPSAVPGKGLLKLAKRTRPKEPVPKVTPKSKSESEYRSLRLFFKGVGRTGGGGGSLVELGFLSRPGSESRLEELPVLESTVRSEDELDLRVASYVPVDRRDSDSVLVFLLASPLDSVFELSTLAPREDRVGIAVDWEKSGPLRGLIVDKSSGLRTSHVCPLPFSMSSALGRTPLVSGVFDSTNWSYSREAVRNDLDGGDLVDIGRIRVESLLFFEDMPLDGGETASQSSPVTALVLMVPPCVAEVDVVWAETAPTSETAPFFAKTTLRAASAKSWYATIPGPWAEGEGITRDICVLEVFGVVFAALAGETSVELAVLELLDKFADKILPPPLDEACLSWLKFGATFVGLELFRPLAPGLTTVELSRVSGGDNV
jgi:hypothetical protein